MRISDGFHSAPRLRLTLLFRSHEGADRLAPNHSFSASLLHEEIGNPSPINSSGTNSTDMDDSVQDEFENEAGQQQESPKHPESISGGSVNSDLTVRSPHNPPGPSFSEFPGQPVQAKIKALDTSVPTRARSDSDDAPVSVILAPTGFHEPVSHFTPTNLKRLLLSATTEPVGGCEINNPNQGIAKARPDE